jgi:hypothetical protein
MKETRDKTTDLLTSDGQPKMKSRRSGEKKEEKR